MTSLRFDPFRELDRWAADMMGAARVPRLMPVDVYRHKDSYVLQFDLPGAAPDSLELTAENSTLTVRAERRPAAPEGAEYITAERPTGVYSRQLVLGEGLDHDRIAADYRDGALTVSIPVAEEAKPRKIVIGRGLSHEGHKVISGEVRQPSAVTDRSAAEGVRTGG